MQFCDIATEEFWPMLSATLGKDNLEYKIWFDDEKRYLKTIFHTTHTRIDHIGSSAVGDLACCGIVDILVQTDEDKFDTLKQILIHNGYQETKILNKFSKKYSQSGCENREFSLYLRQFDDNDELYFRDWLIFSPKSRAQYEALKIKLLKQSGNNTEHKSEFIKNCVVLAKAEFQKRHSAENSNYKKDKASAADKNEVKQDKKKRIVFMGTPKYAVEILDKIIQNYDVPLVLTQPDRPVGRKGILTPPEVKKYLLEVDYKTQILQPTSLKNSQIQNQIKEVKPDFIIVAAYGQILPKEILDIAPCINLHASILPKFRGASPIQSAILNGEELSGVTAMMMGVGLDDGDMLAFSCVDIRELNSEELFDVLGKMASNLTLDVLSNFDILSPLAQTHASSSKCKKIQKQDGMVDFINDADEVVRKFKAFTPWPGLFLENGIKLLDIKFNQNGKFEFGTILSLTKNSFVVGFRNGTIEIIKLQEAGKKPVSGAEFINGKRLKIGDRIC